MQPLRIVLVGTVASCPYAGMAWMHMQMAEGFRRLGHEVYYFEITSAWPYDPVRQTSVCDSNFALPYLRRVLESFGLADRWAYRRSYSDHEWCGLARERAEDLLAHADAVFNVSGATRFADQGIRTGRLIYYGTDPVTPEIEVAKSGGKHWILDEHDDFVTYGENIGRPECLIPPLPGLRAHTRQPVLLDQWQAGQPSRNEFTTIGNWKQTGQDIEFRGETYSWSKHHEYLKFIDLPLRTKQPIELAMGLANIDGDTQQLLRQNGWQLADAHAFTTDTGPYREYIQASRGEFTVAKDQNVRLKSGWFSERSACYLAAGRPVVTQDTGFGTVLPTGEGLFAFNTMDDILAAFDAIHADYAHHSRAARAIAEEYFRAETVLARLLGDLGL